MLKATLRQVMLQKRVQYTSAEIDGFSKQIAKLFFSYFSPEGVNTIHIFLPIQKKNEINTWFIIRKLWEDYAQVRVVVSISNTQDFTLSHFNLLPQTKLVENKWGIPEPEGSEAVSVEEIDMVIVPLLAFDAHGHRVGYGKGFYDRFLNACRPDALKIGLSLEASVKRITDIHPGDVVLDHAVTPTDVISFNKLKE